MKKYSAICVLLLLIILPSNILAATFYMKDGTTFTGKIVGETTASFHVKKHGMNYSIIHEYSDIEKIDIFAVIDKDGALRYPTNLKWISTDRQELSQEEFRNLLLKDQVMYQREQAKSVKGIYTIMFIQFLIILGGGIAIAISAS